MTFLFFHFLLMMIFLFLPLHQSCNTSLYIHSTHLATGVPFFLENPKTGIFLLLSFFFWHGS
jgi:hypothetical protein